MRKAVIITAVLSLLIVVLVLAGCSGDSDGDPVPGNPAPNFQLKSLDGLEISLSELKGRPVLLNFWASWCGPCRYEMPFLNEVYQDQGWQKRGLVILAVNLGEPTETVREFVEFYGLSFPILLDSQGEVGLLYNAAALPTSYSIDNGGIIRSVKRGAFVNKASIDQFLMKAE